MASHMENIHNDEDTARADTSPPVRRSPQYGKVKITTPRVLDLATSIFVVAQRGTSEEIWTSTCSNLAPLFPNMLAPQRAQSQKNALISSVTHPLPRKSSD